MVHKTTVSLADLPRIDFHLFWTKGDFSAPPASRVGALTDSGQQSTPKEHSDLEVRDARGGDSMKRFVNAKDRSIRRGAAAMLTIALTAILGCCVSCQADEQGPGSSSSDAFYAAEVGNLKTLEALIDSDPDVVHSRDSVGRTPLHYAADGNQVKAVKLLIEHGARVDERDRMGYTPLHVSAFPGALDAARTLIELGADPNARQKSLELQALGEGSSVLEIAAMRGHAELVKLLLEREVEVQDKKRKGRDTALHRACMGLLASKYRDRSEYVGNRKVLALLVPKFDDPNVRNLDHQTPLQVAAASGAAETVDYLLENHPNVNREAEASGGNTALHLAVHSEPLVKVPPERRAAVIAVLLKHGANTEARNNDGHTPLERARAHADETVIRVLVEAHSSAHNAKPK
ncbi:MAG: ankyrin repeat domain-containing protein [Planctomycetes bacterium]|nr:ankyrin repeat domain-containing protein [Planctomycetota bacterium]